MGDDPSPKDRSPEAIAVRSTAIDSERKPDLQQAVSVVLKEGKRTRKVATHWTIRNRHTEERHHDALSIKTYRGSRNEWVEDPEHSISLEGGEGDDEIQKLLDFILVARGASVPQASENFVVVAAPGDERQREALRKIMGSASASGKADALAEVLERSMGDAEFFRALIERAARSPQLFAEAAAALNLVTYKRAAEELRGMIEAQAPVREATLQAFLQEHPWMFGSEYSELLGRRRWTRDEEQDFVLRRTTDGYIELVEIKTPLNGVNLFVHDRSHNSHYAGAELSKAIGQVAQYIEKLDARRDAILADDQEDTCKIRAKIIIGRDGDEGQQEALRRLNGHLHRVEVLTFDQLLRIAEGVLGYVEGAMRPGV